MKIIDIYHYVEGRRFNTDLTEEELRLYKKIFELVALECCYCEQKAKLLEQIKVIDEALKND